MKVAIVIDIFHDKGNGTSMSARHLVENLIERGIEVKVLCTNKGQDGETLEGVEFVTFPVQQVPVYQKVIDQQHAWLASPNDDRIRLALQDVDLVHIYMPFFWARTAHALLMNWASLCSDAITCRRKTSLSTPK